MRALSSAEAEGSIVGHLGACGSGKTWKLKARVAAAVRSGWRGAFLIADVKREWPAPDGAGELGPLLYGAPAVRMRRGMRGSIDAGTVHIVRPRPEEDLAEWFDAICARAMEAGGTVVVAPEVWHYAREHERMSPALESLVHEYRHRACGLWWDAQSFAEVKKELVRRTGFLFIHGTGAHEDLRRLEAMGGHELSAAVLEAQRRNVLGRSGHHVVFRQANPFPPFVVRGPNGEAIETATAAEGAAGASKDARPQKPMRATRTR